MENLTGKQLGAYQIVAPLGEGGMAAVYQAFHAAMERYVALKILPRQFASDPQFIIRFKQEAKVLAQLQHPHILPVFDFGEADGYTYLVMPFIKSGTLTDLLQGDPLGLPRINRIMEQLGGALEYAHQRGLVHRDVKPSNVLIDESHNCLLADFGLAKILESSAKLTSSGAVMGTPIYMSPEQGLGRTVDGRSDVYALGVMLYEMATGRVPYHADTPMAVMLKHISDPLPPPRSLNPKLPEAVEAVILKALVKEPDSRYQTAAALVKALDRAVRASEPAASLRVSRPALDPPTQAPQPNTLGPTVWPVPRKTAPPIEPATRRRITPVQGLIVSALALAVLCGLLTIGGALAMPTLASLWATPTQVAVIALPTEALSPTPGESLPSVTPTTGAQGANTPRPTDTTAPTRTATQTVTPTVTSPPTLAPTRRATAAPATATNPPPTTSAQAVNFETSGNCTHTSPPADGTTAITFVNTSNRDVSVYWLDGNGAELFYFDVQMGGSVHQVTGPGHWWCVREKYTGNTIIAAAAGTQPQSFNIPAPAANCSRVSEGGTAATTIRFVNKSQRTVMVYWVDFDAAEQFYAELTIGQSYDQETGVNHFWCVRDKASGAAILGAGGTIDFQTINIP